MKKIFLIIGVLLSMTTNSFSIIALMTEYTCPIGGEKFKTHFILPQCPTNKFVMFKREFTKEELEKYEKIINSKEYKSIPKNPSEHYYLAKFYELAGGFSDIEIGKAYYNAYNELAFYGYKKNENIIKEAFTKGISYLEKSLASRDKNDFPWDLAYLYVYNKEYDKVNLLMEKQDKNLHLERIANFYYSISDAGRVEENNKIYKIDDEKAKKYFRKKALYYLQELSKKNSEPYLEEILLIRQAILHKSLGDTKSLDELFSKTPSEYWTSVILFYLDEPENNIGKVFNEKNPATEEDLKKALTYAEKLVKVNEKNNKRDITEKNKYNHSLILKAESERRLGKFEEASKTLSKINLKDIKETIYVYNFEKLKELIEKKDSTVEKFFPPKIMY